MDIVLSHIGAVLLAASVAVAPQQPPAAPTPGQAAQPPSAAQQAASGEAIDLPVSIDKIQRALSRPPVISPKTSRPVFRVEVIARKPTIAEILGPDYLVGPVPYGGMTHQEFLNMVTPAQYRGYSMFTNKEGLTVAASSFALQWALMKAIDKFKDARDERAKEAARKEVMSAMNELEAARRKAGLPRK